MAPASAGGAGWAAIRASFPGLGDRVCISRRYTNQVGRLRASVHFFNNEEDLDALVREAARARDGA